MYGSVYTSVITINGASLGQFWSNYFVYVTEPGGACTHSASSPTRLACSATAPCTIPVLPQQLSPISGCSDSILMLGTIGTYASYKWMQPYDTAYSASPILYKSHGGYVTLEVTDTNGCKGVAGIYLTGGGAVSAPNVCYISADTSAEVPVMLMAFQKNDFFGNVTRYEVKSVDTGSVWSSTVEAIFPTTGTSIFRDTVRSHYSYNVSARTICGDSISDWGLLPYRLSILSVDTTGQYPVLSWQLQFPTNYSSITVWSRVAGQSWIALDTIYANNVVSGILSYTDIHASGAVTEYMLSYEITGACDPSRSSVTGFTNRARTSVVQQQPNAVTDLAATPLRVYPNPATDRLYVSIPGTIETDIRIYDLMGTMLYDKAATAGTTMIDVSSYAAGIYLVRAMDQSGHPLSISKFSKK